MTPAAAGAPRRDRGRIDCLGPLGRGALIGRITIGLYNGYDPKTWHDIMRGAPPLDPECGLRPHGGGLCPPPLTPRQGTSGPLDPWDVVG